MASSSGKLQKLKTVPFKALFRYATTTDKWLNALGVITALISGFLYPMTTFVFGEIIDTFGKWQIAPGKYVTPDELAETTANKTIWFLYLAAAELVTTYLCIAAFVHTGGRQVHTVREEYLKAVLRQDMAWYDNVGAGEITTRLTSDTLLIQDAVSDKIPLALSQVAVFISGFALAFYRSWHLTLVLLSVIPLIAIAAVVSNTIAGKFQTKVLQKYSQAGTLAEEAIAAVRTVTSLNAQSPIGAMYNENVAAATGAAIKKNAVSGLGFGLLNTFIYCGYSLTFYYSYQLIQEHLISAGTVVNVFFAILIGSFALGQIAPEMQAITIGRSAAANVFSTIDRIPAIDPYDTKGQTIPDQDIQGRIEFQKVEFSYPSRSEVKALNSLDLVIEPGTTVALVGTSGSGKSTIVQLIERFYDPDSGRITLDGIPFKELNLNWLRRHIGFVQQEPILFEGSVFDNVAFGLEKQSTNARAKVEEACRRANAHEFIMNLPEKYETQVGSRGSMLSGGQKQRIAIARAIVNSPRILLLDEATAALDSNSEAAVQKTLNEVAKFHTTIVVAHRLSTVKNADLIVVMSFGKVVEKGTHESLIAANGMYAKLVEAQSLDTNFTSLPANDKSIATSRSASVSRRQPPDTEKVVLQMEREEGDKKLDLTGGLSTWGIFSSVLRLNAPELKYSIPALFCAVIIGLIYPFFAVALSSIIEIFSIPGPNLESDAKFWSLVFLLIGIAFLVLSFSQQFLFGLASSLLTERLRRLVFAAILQQDIGFFDDADNSTGVLTSQLATDTQNIQGASGSTLGTILQVSTNLVAGMIVGLAYGWKLALVAITALPIMLLSGMIRVKIIVYFTDKNKLAYERSAQLACEAAAGIKTVQALTYEKTIMEKYGNMLEGPLRDGFKNAWMNSSLYAFSQSTNFLVNALVFWYGGRLIAYEGYGIKQMMTVFVAIVFGSMSAGRVLAFAPDLNKAKDSARSIIRMLNRRPAIDSKSNSGYSVNAQKITGKLEFRDVVFKYPQRPGIPVLKGINIKVAAGQFVALVGPSGSGKSTTIQLLERYYDVSEGGIFIDDMNIADLNVAAYRNIVGLVSQEPNLFDMTILENICLGLEREPPMEEVEAACRSANIHEFIASLEKGYHTRVGGKGSQLSGGQKQRIAIARALIRNPKILLLDEATSALDTESEKIVQEALDLAAKGRTTIAVAHRLSTIQHANMIYVFKGGAVIEKGDHASLYNKKGLYYDLVVQQTLTPQ